MKKNPIAISFIFICFSLSSCITSLQPLVTQDNVVLEERLEGKWIHENQNFTIDKISDTLLKRILGPENYPNRKNDSLLLSRSYNITCRKDNITYDFNLALTRVGDDLFMNLAPAGFEPNINDDAWMKKYGSMLQYLPTYTIAKLEIVNRSRLIIKFLDGGFIKDQVQAGKIRIKHEANDLFDMFLITASSAELQQFLKKYGNDQRLYVKGNTVILQRKEYTNVGKKNMD